ncbi:MAG: M20/M25/M40 family metallo-hydrolase [Thermoanaerobaculia bacterium]|nr:M20/M25/M40 family metallo-hydrolase [Thermoanaerobaculia bacterium]
MRSRDLIRSGAAARAVDLLEELVAIPSVTGSEGPVLDFLENRYRDAGWTVETMEVSAPARRNLFIHRGHPRVVLMTHADTVPPYFEPRREKDVLIARGACDAKGSLAAMAIALEALAAETDEAGLLVLVGEEKGSDGALAANRRPHLAQYLVGGEPTENRFVAGAKGCLRIVVETRGVAGHSSIPESGSSAVEPMLDLLSDLRSLHLPEHPLFGRTTMNIGLLQAGTAPNVIADGARAEIVFRTGEPVERLLAHVHAMAARRAEVTIGYRSDPVSFRCPRGSAGEVVSFACDLPLLPAWGEPILVGPGSILEAHAAEERVDVPEVEKAVSIYAELVEGLLSRGDEHLEGRR